MADFGSPVAPSVNVNPSQGIQTLSGLLSLKQQRQQLQTGQFQQETAQAQAQQEQQTAQQRSAAANFFKSYDVASHVGPDGTIDLDQALTNPALKATGDAYPAIAKSLIDMKSSQLDAKQKLATLDSGLRQNFYQNVGGLAADPDVKQGNQQGAGKVLDAIDEFGKSGGPDAARVAAIYRPLIQSLTTAGMASKLPEVLRNFQLQAQDAGHQTEQTYGTQATVDTGGTIQPGVQAPPAAGGGFTPAGSAIPKTLPPSADVITDAYGRQFRLNRQTNTVEPIGAGTSQGSGPANAGPGFQQPVAGQQQVLQDVENVRAIGDQAPANRNINQHLLQLSEETRTAPGMQGVQKVAAFLGLPSGSKFQEISAYLDRQAAMSARQMGVPNTNAGLAAAQSASGTTEYTPQALQEKVKFADALNSATIAYRQGLDKAVGTGATPDLKNYQSFRSAWAKNFDPDIYRAEDAQRRGDNAELESIKKRLGPKGMKDLANKSSNLRELENGEIPGG